MIRGKKLIKHVTNSEIPWSRASSVGQNGHSDQKSIEMEMENYTYYVTQLSGLFTVRFTIWISKRSGQLLFFI